MELREAIKAGKVIEVELDVYLTEDNRILHYDRYFKKNPRRCSVSAMWVDDEGNVFYNFSDAYGQRFAYRWAN